MQRFIVQVGVVAMVIGGLLVILGARKIGVAMALSALVAFLFLPAVVCGSELAYQWLAAFAKGHTIIFTAAALVIFLGVIGMMRSDGHRSGAKAEKPATSLKRTIER